MVSSRRAAPHKGHLAMRKVPRESVMHVAAPMDMPQKPRCNGRHRSLVVRPTAESMYRWLKVSYVNGCTLVSTPTAAIPSEADCVKAKCRRTLQLDSHIVRPRGNGNDGSIGPNGWSFSCRRMSLTIELSRTDTALARHG